MTQESQEREVVFFLSDYDSGHEGHKSLSKYLIGDRRPLNRRFLNVTGVYAACTL